MIILESVFLNNIIIINVHFISFFLLSFYFNVKSLAVCLHKVYAINVSPVHILQSPPLRVNSHSSSLVNSNDFNSITRLYKIYKVLIAAESNSLRCFSFRHSFRGFLKFDMLFVTEEALVMHQLESLSLSAVPTKVRLN
jgi:hypothetical protein